MSGQRGRPPYQDALTPAEWRVVQCVRHGMTNRIIAERLEVSQDAVKFHVANALQKLGFRTRAELKHWNGVPRASALYATEADMDAPLVMGPIGQIARHVKDLEAATTWYRDVLGLKYVFTASNMAFFDCDGTSLQLGAGEVQDPGASILYFRVPDIRAAHAELARRGVVFTNAPHIIHTYPDKTELWMAFFTDNEDRTLAIMADVKPRAS